MALSAKHEAVALAYIADRARCGWRAYQSVYLRCTQRAAAVAWSRLLTNADFSARLAELAEAAAQGAVMTAQEVLQELTTIARASDISPKLRALELLGKHHKLYVDRHEHDFAAGVAERLAAAIARVGQEIDPSDADERQPEPAREPPAGKARPKKRPPRRAPRASRKSKPARKGKPARPR
jgi:hypothetical protein